MTTIAGSAAATSSASGRVGSPWFAFVVVAACMWTVMPARAEVCSAKSGSRTVALVELYTSEGCDSCPPADRWLASTFPVGATGANAIALAFHVDYWDRLGWKDRFAAPEWTERQHAAARANRSSFVYTPQVLVQGRELAGWRSKTAAAAVAATAAAPARASVALEAEARRGVLAVKAAAHVQRDADRAGAALYVVLADSAHVSEVKAGENAGARLAHDHVVRALRGGFAVNGSGEAIGEITLPLPAEPGRAPTVVAFVQNPATGDVLQALALPVAGCASAR